MGEGEETTSAASYNPSAIFIVKFCSGGRIGASIAQSRWHRERHLSPSNSNYQQVFQYPLQYIPIDPINVCAVILDSLSLSLYRPSLAPPPFPTSSSLPSIFPSCSHPRPPPIRHVSPTHMRSWADMVSHGRGNVRVKFRPGSCVHFVTPCERSRGRDRVPFLESSR